MTRPTRRDARRAVRLARLIAAERVAERERIADVIERGARVVVSMRGEVRRVLLDGEYHSTLDDEKIQDVKPRPGLASMIRRIT